MKKKIKTTEEYDTEHVISLLKASAWTGGTPESFMHITHTDF